MKSCPTCNRTYTDASLNFCLEDGTPLTLSAPPASPGFDPNATIRYVEPRGTQPPQPAPPPSLPPASHASPQPPSQASYAPAPPVASMGSPFGQQQYTPALAPPRRKSNAVWWILGGSLVLGVIVVGAVIMILALASMNKDSNVNGNANRANANARNANRNANANANIANANVNATTTLPALLTDDFRRLNGARATTRSATFGTLTINTTCAPRRSRTW